MEAGGRGEGNEKIGDVERDVERGVVEKGDKVECNTKVGVWKDGEVFIESCLIGEGISCLLAANI